jgi:Ni/Fe-hydrogenase subunit HybB-like protein
MSIHKNWHSSLFSWYILSASLTCAVAVLIIAVFIFNNGPEAKAKKTLQTLTNYLFAFSCFWAYLWFSQYLLMWYGNLPEETSFILTVKQHYPWFMIIEIMLGFVLPFLLLLSPVFRQNNLLIFISAVSVFIAHWIGFYVFVFSGLFPEGHTFSAIEMSTGLIFLTLFAYSTWYGVQKRNIKIT